MLLQYLNSSTQKRGSFGMTRINETNRKPKELTVPVNIGTDQFMTN
jgi:hypothetical protein